MRTTITADHKAFDSAIAAARHTGPITHLDGVSAIVNADLLGRIEELWDRVEAALREAFQNGKERLASITNSVLDQVQQLINYAGTQAKEVHDALNRRLAAFTRTFLEGIFASVPSSLRVGDTQFSLATVKLSQKLVATGSVKTNLLDAIELAAEGEVEVETEYSMPKALSAMAGGTL